MDNYYKILNKIMTEYSSSLNTAYNKMKSRNRNNLEDNPLLFSQDNFRRLIEILKPLSDIMKIMEFVLLSYPDQFYDIKNINFSRFSNFLKNLSSRILDSNYFEKLTEIVKVYKPKEMKECIDPLVMSSVGVMLNAFPNKEDENVSEFVNKLVSLSDFDVLPFYNTLKHLDLHKGSTEPAFEDSIKTFKGILDFLAAKKSKKVEKKMTEQEWEETMKKENICIICYVNESDRVLLPCRHSKKNF
jgi:hypothetical protein